ncbi:hypothetical protein H0H87_009529, partial [Tephrocybe sp. NHM501043]
GLKKSFGIRKQFWSTGIRLAIPLIWLAWSIASFVVGMIILVWRNSGNTDSSSTPSSSSDKPDLSLRTCNIIISAVLGGGILLTAYNVYKVGKYKRKAEIDFLEDMKIVEAEEAKMEQAEPG